MKPVDDSREIKAKPLRLSFPVERNHLHFDQPEVNLHLITLSVSSALSHRTSKSELRPPDTEDP